jgi:hypothetical protein
MSAVQDLKIKFNDFKASLRAIINDAIEAGDIIEDEVNDIYLENIINKEAEPVSSGDAREKYSCKEVSEETDSLIWGRYG